MDVWALDTTLLFSVESENKREFEAALERKRSEIRDATRQAIAGVLKESQLSATLKGGPPQTVQRRSTPSRIPRVMAEARAGAARRWLGEDRCGG